MFWAHLGSVTMRFQGGRMGVREYIQGRRCRFRPAQIHKYTIIHNYTNIQRHKDTLGVREYIQGWRCRLDSIAVSAFADIFGQFDNY